MRKQNIKTFNEMAPNEKNKGIAQIVKQDIKGVKATTKVLWQIAKKDKVDLAMFLLAIIISVLDFATDINLMGGLAFLTVYISSLIFRLTVWKYKYIHKQIK